MPRPRKLKPKPHARGWHEGSVAEVRPGVWRAFRARVHRPDGSTVRPSKTFQGANAEAQAAVWAKGDPEPTVMLLGLWLSRWLALRRASLDPSTFDHYRRDVLECAPLAGRPIADLTVDDWQLLTDALLSRWARKTVAVWRGNISTALRAAVKRGYLASNPLSDVILPQTQESPPKAWTQAEVDRLLAVCVGHQHEPWLLFCLGTGVRLGESRALLWADVDLVRATATIRASLDNQTSERGPTKTRKIRTVDIPDEVVTILRAHQLRRKPGELLVFGHDGRAYRPRSYRSWLLTRTKEAGVSPLSCHSTRHTFVSLALDAGVPIQDISRAIGHAKISTTQDVYSHYIGDGLRRAATALGAALRNRFSGPKRDSRANIDTR